MLKGIKSNPLRLFLLRIIIALVLLSFIWVIIIYFYYEDQLAKKIDEKLNSADNKYIELFKKVDFEKKNEAYYNYVNAVDEGARALSLLEVEILDENKNVILEKNYKEHEEDITKTIEDFVLGLEGDSSHVLIPISSSEFYFYYQYKFNLNSKIYYVNILKEVDSKLVESIEEEAYMTILIILMTVVFIGIVIFPIVYSQYKQVLKKENELILANLNILNSLGNAVAKRDSDTNEHNFRVTYYSFKIAQAMNLSKESIKTLIKGSFLHDVGKIAISDNILLKPGKLTSDEFKVMQTHVEHGVELVEDIPWLIDAKKVILCHHEKVNGTGYPNGLKYEQIPLEARIFAVADVFDALSSKRPYKEPMAVDKCFEIIKNDEGTHFDKEVVEVFEKIYEKLYGSVLNKSEDELKILFDKELKPFFVYSV